MSEPPTLPPAETTPPFEETPRSARFGGILEGHRGPELEMRERVAALNALGLARGDLEIEGGRFSLLMAEEPMAGERITPELIEEFQGCLAALIALSPRPAEVESTINCTLYFAGEAQECLFAVAEGELRLVTRRRPLKESDRPDLPPPTGRDPLAQLSRGKALLIGGLLIAVFLILAWQKNYFHRLFKADPETIRLETGPFGELLALEAKSHWGTYKVKVVRGQAYPETAKAVEELLARATTPAARAAINAVANGLDIYAQLRTDEDKVVAARPLELRPLLSKSDGKVVLSLPGRMDAAAIRLAIDRGLDRDE